MGGSGEYEFPLTESEPPPAFSGDDPYVGKIFGKRYRIVAKIAEGAQARVYRARHMAIKREVAIKVLLPVLASDKAIVNRFLNEGRAAGTIGHPNIAESFDMGFAPDGAPYLVLELLQGKTLAEELAQMGPFLERRAIHVTQQIASAVGAAHARGIIHRDLKPENVFLVERGGRPDHVKVLDFGISKFAGGTKVTTRKGQFLGTPDFMAPEQIEDPGSVDGRADVYALGVLLYSMLAGEAPFAHVEFPKVLRTIVEDSPRPLLETRPDLPPHLVEFVERAMSKNRDHRYQTMQEAEEALLGFQLLPRGARTSGVVASVPAPTPSEAKTTPRLPSPDVTQPLPRYVAPAPAANANAVPTTPSPGIPRAALIAGGAALFALVVAGAFVAGRIGRAPATAKPVAIASAPAPAPQPPPAPEPQQVAPAPAPAPTPTAAAVASDPEPSALPGAAPKPFPVAAPAWRPARTAAAADPTPPEPPEPATASVVPPAVVSAAPPIASAAPTPAAAPPPATATGPAPGSIDHHAVNATVRAHSGEVRACYDRARMYNADLRGRVTVRAGISADGRVTSADVASSSAQDARLESCLVGAFRGWQFPAPAGGVAGSVSYTFVFE